jgi:hypothetical protein
MTLDCRAMFADNIFNQVITLMPNPFVSGRVPISLFEALESHCSNTGMTRTEALICALESYLGVRTSDSADALISVDRILGLEEYVQQLVKEQVHHELQKITARAGTSLNPKSHKI